MTEIRVRPDMRTAGGEVNDIVIDGRYAGTLTFVYREGDRMSGSVQLQNGAFADEQKDGARRFVQDHVRALADAWDIPDCEVVMTFSDFEEVIVIENPEAAEAFLYGDEDPDQAEIEYVNDFPREVDIDPDAYEELDMRAEDGDADQVYELVIVSESRNQVNYRIYDENKELLATANVRFQGGDALGEVDWKLEPEDEEIDHVSDLIIADLDDEHIETITLDMASNGRFIDSIDLVREDIWDDMTPDRERPPAADADDYSIVLVRDDGSALTYDIYKQSQGGLPIGTATLDITLRQITGFIDFQKPGTSEDRAVIANQLLRELDKEKEFESVNLSMLHKNEKFDELYFDTERVH